MASDAPRGPALQSIAPTAYLLDPGLRCEDGASFTPMHCFRGRTENVDSLECHYSVLMPGGSPHAPHAHREEEILVVMHGSAELVVPSPLQEGMTGIFPAPAGTAIYYPSFQRHTIRNASEGPVTYAMLRWTSEPVAANDPLIPCLLQAAWLKDGVSDNPISMTRLVEGSTAFLGKLHAHATRILPGGGYEAHRDSHDVAIFLLKGEIAVLGHHIRAPGICFMPAGSPHDMRSIGADPAQYLVWEFHKSAAPPAPHSARATETSTAESAEG